MRTKSYLYLLVWGIFIAACAYMIPYFSNDYRYMLIQGSDAMVTSLSDIVTSQWQHYFYWGGRAVAHTIAQLLLFWGKNVSAITTALCYLAVILLCISLGSGKTPIACLKSLKLVPCVIVTMALWLCLRIYGEVVFMLVSSCNYLYTTCLVLLFLVPFRIAITEDKEHGLVFAFLMFLLGMIAGWTNENTGLAACAAVFFVDLWCFKKKRLRSWMVCASLGLVIGYLLLMLSPGNSARLDSMESGGFTFLGHLPAAIKIYFSTLLTQLPLLIAIAYLCYRIIKSGAIKQHKLGFYAVLWLFLTGFISLSVMLGSPNFPNRSTAPFTIFSAACLVGLYFYAKEHELEILPKKGVVALSLLCVLYTIPTAINTLQGYYQAMLDGRARDFEIASQIADGKKDLVVKPFHVKTSKYLFIGDVRAQKTYFANLIVQKFYKVHSIRRACNYVFPWYSYDYMIWAKHDESVCTKDRGDPEDPQDKLNQAYDVEHPKEIARLKFPKDGSYSKEQFILDMKLLGMDNAEAFLKE